MIVVIHDLQKVTQLLIDEKYGDDLREINHKNKQLLNCISILGVCTVEQLSILIDEHI